MIALSVSEISTLGGFCDEDEDELGILVVGYEIQEQRAIHWENYCLYTIVLTPLIYKGHGVERGGRSQMFGQRPQLMQRAFSFRSVSAHAVAPAVRHSGETQR